MAKMAKKSKKTSFKKTVHISILVVVAIVWFCILQLFILPHMWHKMAIPRFLDDIGLVRFWYYFMVILAIVTVIIMFTFFVFWVIWEILNLIHKLMKKIPIIGTAINKALIEPIMKLPPFPDLKKAGIFKMFRKIFMGGPNFFKNLVNGLGAFFAKSTVMLMKETRGIVSRSTRKKRRTSKSSKSSKSKKSKGKKSKKNKKSETSTDDYYADQYQQCLEENIIPITPDMSPTDITVTNQKNYISRMNCKLQRLLLGIHSLPDKLR